LNVSYTIHEAIAVGPDRRECAASLGSGRECVSEGLGHAVESFSVVYRMSHRSRLTDGRTYATHVHAERLHERLAVFHDFLLGVCAVWRN
jgi:hypothetical protein